ncbi:ComEC/Rec2 family competence protein [Aurantimonas sp. CSK15Z-1]|nr:ComEC/Rec2 family competence protein [Aurantimonas sp. CSK15Z-1]MCQ8782580.1 ComEC/Rec2 family competence protein [Aurantimonas sp. CSK15Z-1]
MSAVHGSEAAGNSERQRSAPGGRVRSRLGAAVAALRMEPETGGLGGWLARQAAIEAGARTGFYVLPFGMILGIVFVDGAGLRIPPAAAAFAAALCLVAAWRLQDRRLARLPILGLGALAFGVALAQIELRRDAEVIFSGEATVRISGLVLWRDSDDRGRQRYLLRIDATERPQLSRPPRTARIVVTSRHVPVPVGHIYQGLVRLRAPSGPAYPGGHDFAFAPLFEGPGAYGFGLGPPDADAALSAGEPPDVATAVGLWLTRVRLAISDRVRSVIGGPEGAVASALITGERSGIPEPVNEWLRATGLAHVLSISGFHMALVAGFAMLIARGALAAIPGLALTANVKKWAAAIAFLVATLYLLISGGDVATQRSYVMLAIMLLAILADRDALTLRNVALAGMAVLLIAPHGAMTASFQMSFAATAALVGFYGAASRWWARRRAGRARSHTGTLRTVVLFLTGLALSSLIAGTATAPFAAYHFQRLAPYGLVANVLVMPIFSLWIMPLALLAVLVMPFGLDWPLLWLMGEGLSVVFDVTRYLAVHLPNATTGLLTTTGLTLLTLALCVGAFLSSALRWIAVPIALAGLLLAPDRQERPELLVFEDGREVALLDVAGRLQPLRERPGQFVMAQWERAFPPAPDERAAPDEADASADPETSAEDPPEPIMDGLDGPGSGSSRSSAAPSAPASPAALRPKPTRPEAHPRGATRRPAVTPPPSAFMCRDGLCRATSRGGLKVVWTEDYTLLGRACDEADVVIVARAARTTTCRSGAMLATLRTLRRSGSLAIRRSPVTGRAEAETSVDPVSQPWNAHRLERWPEFWRKPDDANPAPAASPRSAPASREAPPAADGAAGGPQDDSVQ